MKAQPISRTIYQNNSFLLKKYFYKNFLKVWHYHPEVEFIIILESTGTRFIGDSIEKFKPGDMVMIGENLPHQWLNDEIYFEKGSGLQAKCYGIHFHQRFDEYLLNTPELNGISKLFERAKHGIKFEGDSNQQIKSMVEEMFELRGCDKLIKLLHILKLLSYQTDYKILSSAGYINSFNENKDNKILRVYEYIMNNFTRDVCLDEAALQANMNPSAFSRYFKRIHKKTFTQFLNEIKIGYACKLLIEQKLNISEICYKSGFNNVSNFNRQFKSLKKTTPTEYIKMYTSSSS